MTLVRDAFSRPAGRRRLGRRLLHGLLATTSALAIGAAAQAQCVTDPTVPYTNTGTVACVTLDDTGSNLGAYPAGNVTNASTGAITGSASADSLSVSIGVTITGSVVNDGAITVGGSSNNAISVIAGAVTGNILNAGNITGSGNGVLVSGVEGGSGFSTVPASVGGAIDNSGAITVGGVGIFINNDGATVGSIDNSGSITQSAGGAGSATIVVANGGTVTGNITNSGALGAGSQGSLFVEGAAGGIVNTSSGSIAANNATGVAILVGGSAFSTGTLQNGITNAGNISGFIGISIQDATLGAAIVNTGDITSPSNGAAIDLAPEGSDPGDPSGANTAMTIDQNGGNITGNILLSTHGDTVNITGGAVDGIIDGQLSSNGAAAGTVNFNLGSNTFDFGEGLSVAADVAAININSGTVSFDTADVQVFGALTNAATMSFPGTSTYSLNGNYVQTSTGDLVVAVTHTGQISVFNVVGNANLAGTVTFAYGPGSYSAENLQFLDVSGTRTGTFTTTAETNLPAGFVQSVSYNSSGAALDLAVGTSPPPPPPPVSPPPPPPPPPPMSPPPPPPPPPVSPPPPPPPPPVSPPPPPPPPPVAPPPPPPPPPVSPPPPPPPPPVSPPPPPPPPPVSPPPPPPPPPVSPPPPPPPPVSPPPPPPPPPPVSPPPPPPPPPVSPPPPPPPPPVSPPPPPPPPPPVSPPPPPPPPPVSPPPPPPPPPVSPPPPPPPPPVSPPPPPPPPPVSPPPPPPPPPPLVVAPADAAIFSNLAFALIEENQASLGDLLQRPGASGGFYDLSTSTGHEARGWVEVLGGFLDPSAATHFRSTSGGIQGGVDLALGNGARLGGALGYESGSYSDSAGGSANQNLVRVSLYGSQGVGPVSLSAVVGYSHASQDFARASGIGASTASRGVDETDAAIQAALPIETGGAKLTPSVGVLISYLSAAPFAEANAQSTGFAVTGTRAADNVASPFAKLELSKTLTTASGLAWTPTVLAGYRYDAGASGMNQALIASDGTAFLGNRTGLSPSSALLGFSLAAHQGHWSGFFNYRAEVASDWSNQSLQAGIKVAF